MYLDLVRPRPSYLAAVVTCRWEAPVAWSPSICSRMVSMPCRRSPSWPGKIDTVYAAMHYLPKDAPEKTGW